MSNSGCLSFLPANRSWKASWIWPRHSDPGRSNSVALFRRRCAVSEPAELLINACSNYRLWVNGEIAGDGPCPSAAHQSYYDRYKLPVGEVQIAVVVRTARLQQPRMGGLLAEMIDSAGQLIDASCADWKAVPGDAWSQNSYEFPMNKLSPYQEHLNANNLPIDWEQIDFDDSSWPTAQVLRPAQLRPSPYTHMIERPIAELERDLFLPCEITARETCLHINNRKEGHDASTEACQPGTDELVDNLISHANDLLGENGRCTLRCSQPEPDNAAWDGTRDPALTLRFAEELTAFIEVELTAPAGAVLFIASTERLFDGQFNNMLEGRFTEKYTCREGRQVYRSLNWRAFRYLRLRLALAGSDVLIHAVRAIRVRTPMQREAEFTSGDGMNTIDQLCRRTIRLCSVDGIFDTPWRESAQWLGDVANVTIPALHWVYGDDKLSGKFMMQAGLNATPAGILSNLSNIEPIFGSGNIPDYSLWWMYALREHYWYTGDIQWYRMFYPEVQRIMRWHVNYLDDDGFLNDVGNWVFIDWADTTPNGSLSAYNAIFVMACDVLADMAQLIGDTVTADESRALADRIRRGFVERFWDAERAVIVDAVIDGKQTETISEHGHAAALAFDCLPDEIAHGVIHNGYELGQRHGWVECQPYFTRVLLEGLHAYDRRDLALQIIEDRWGKRFRDRGWDTCLEEWTCNGSYRHGDWSGFQRTTSHAWSAAASEFLQRRLPGIEILEAGGRKISINPWQGDFAYTQRVPLQHGWVSIDYTPGQVPDVSVEGEIELMRDPLLTV